VSFPGSLGRLVCVLSWVSMKFSMCLFLGPCRKGSQRTVCSGSASRGTATTPSPRWSTGARGPPGPGLWRSTREAGPRWAPAHASKPNMSPHTSCPGPPSNTLRSRASNPTKHPNRFPCQRSRPLLPPGRRLRRSSTGPSTAGVSGSGRGLGNGFELNKAKLPLKANYVRLLVTTEQSNKMASRSRVLYTSNVSFKSCYL